MMLSKWVSHWKEYHEITKIDIWFLRQYEAGADLELYIKI